MTTDAFYQADADSQFSWKPCQIITPEDPIGICSVLTPDKMTVQLPADRVIVVPDWVLPEGTYVRDPDGIVWKVDSLMVSGGNSKLSYEMTTVDPKKRFKPYDFFTVENVAHEHFEVLDGSPYLSVDEVQEKLEEADDIIWPIKKEIRRLEEDLREKEKEFLPPIQKACEHEWEKGEDEERSMNMFGRSISRTDECMVCGLTKTVHSTRLG